MRSVARDWCSGKFKSHKSRKFKFDEFHESCIIIIELERVVALLSFNESISVSWKITSVDCINAAV